MADLSCKIEVNGLMYSITKSVNNNIKELLVPFSKNAKPVISDGKVDTKPVTSKVSKKLFDKKKK